MTEEIIERLRSLDLSGGSHSRLSAIASCFLEPAFGWTRGACETLRDKLIETMESKYGNDDNDNSDDCNCNHHRCYQRQVSYDVLGNERQKAVCELRQVPDARTSGNIYDKTVELIYAALGLDCEIAGTFEGLNDLRDRLIHLLGGDQPTLSDLYGTWQDGEKSESRSAESVPEMTKIAEIGELDEHVSQQSHGSSSMRQENETRITDELRNYLGKNGQEYENFSGNTIGAIRGGTTPMYEIADRIDDQLDRICEQQEKVLRQTIDEITDELDSVRAKNRRLTQHIAQMQGGSKKWREKCEALTAERDELQEKNRHLAEKCDAMLVLLGNGAMDAKSDQERRIEKLVRQRDELRKKLKEIGGIVNG